MKSPVYISYTYRVIYIEIYRKQCFNKALLKVLGEGVEVLSAAFPATATDTGEVVGTMRAKLFAELVSPSMPRRVRRGLISTCLG